jgi:hypothetical protein
MSDREVIQIFTGIINFVSRNLGGDVLFLSLAPCR